MYIGLHSGGHKQPKSSLSTAWSVIMIYETRTHAICSIYEYAGEWGADVPTFSVSVEIRYLIQQV
jgi:hypothetical protein